MSKSKDVLTEGKPSRRGWSPFSYTFRTRPNSTNFTLYLMQYDSIAHGHNDHAYFANLRIERRCGVCASPSSGGGGVTSSGEGVTSGGGGRVNSSAAGVTYRHCAAEAVATMGRRHCRDLPHYCDCTGCGCLDIPVATDNTDGEGDLKTLTLTLTLTLTQTLTLTLTIDGATDSLSVGIATVVVLLLVVVAVVVGIALYRLSGPGGEQPLAPGHRSPTSKYITPSMSYHRTRRQTGPRANSNSSVQSEVRVTIRGRGRVKLKDRGGNRVRLSMSYDRTRQSASRHQTC